MASTLARPTPAAQARKVLRVRQAIETDLERLYKRRCSVPLVATSEDGRPTVRDVRFRPALQPCGFAAALGRSFVEAGSRTRRCLGLCRVLLTRAREVLSQHC